MFGQPPVFFVGFCAALAGAGIIGWKIAPEERRVDAASIVSAGHTIAMPICGSGKRINCVVDGDTIWVRGEKIRLEGFNAPEMNGSCDRERRMAVQARDELRRALDGRAFTIERNGKDRYGRTLATIRVGEREVGAELISKGLAHEWRGFKESWC
ncbi:thermonuclease family protein [Neoaquamicrobium sediminum]|uniref:thermonuclease family protein n=1 Tax=Neoaquamicrobium sediminum TaxID=1849104 RepID=UPI001FD374FA|nr:thermonuclease family protein [Mesorhizobium sediminum]